MSLLAETSPKLKFETSAPALSQFEKPLDRVIREGRMVITTEIAERILREANYGGQRKTYDHHVTLLADDMRRSTWIDGSQIVFVRHDGRLFLINGQHRLHAVIASQRDQMFQVFIHDDVKSEAEIARLYYHFDVVQRQRSVPEILNAVGVSERHSISKGMAVATYRAAALIANGLSIPSYQQNPVLARSVDRRLDTARAWWPTAAALEQIIESADRKLRVRLLTAGTVAVALVTLKHQRDKATEFWSGVATNDGLRRGDPRHTLISDLLTRTRNQGNPNQSSIVPANAWNAWYEGARITHIKVYENSVPRVLGTPFDGRRR